MHAHGRQGQLGGQCGQHSSARPATQTSAAQAQLVAAARGTPTRLAVVGGVLLVRLLVGRDAAVRLAGLGGRRQRVPSERQEGQEAGHEEEQRKREQGPGGMGSTAGWWQPRCGAAAAAKPAEAAAPSWCNRQPSCAGGTTPARLSHPSTHAHEFTARCAHLKGP